MMQAYDSLVTYTACMRPTLGTFINIWEEMARIRVHSGTSRVKTDKYSFVTAAIWPQAYVA